MNIEAIRQELTAAADCFRQLAGQADTVGRIADMCARSLRAGHKILFCGNGGSAADSQHLAAELIGRYKMERRPLPAIALTTDTSILTAVGNDYGYDDVFRRQVEGLGEAGDVLVAISTSGNSRNVLLAMRQARKMGIASAAFTGAGGGAMKDEADVCLAVPSSLTNHIQEMHIACGHLVCEYIERSLYG